MGFYALPLTRIEDAGTQTYANPQDTIVPLRPFG